MIINRLTVNGRDYFLPDPVSELRDQILKAIQAGGGYVDILPINGGPGVTILFSPGGTVQWTQLTINNETPLSQAEHAELREIHEKVVDDI